MNHRVIAACCIALFLSLSLAIGQSKDDCTAKCPAGAKMSSASCCMHGTKASLSTTAKSGQDPRIVTVSGKECPMKGVKNAGNCTAAEKANCDMSKADCDMSKASMTKASTKAGCCQMKTKGAEAKNMLKKSGAKVAEAKGTN